jgi:hypothetical protein
VKRQAVWATLVGAALAAWLTYPTIVHPASMARLDTGDGRFSLWNVAWVAHALVDAPSSLFDANIFHPHTGTLAYSEANLVAGAMAAPVYALTRHPVAAHNVTVFVAFVICFVATWALVRRFIGDWRLALVPATAFTFSPFVAARTPHIQLLMIFVFPVVLLALHRFVERPGVGRGSVLGLALALAALACGYYGIYAGLAVGLGLLWWLPGQTSPRRYWVGSLAAGVVAASLVAPVLQPYLALRDDAGARQTSDVEELRGYSADWRAYLTSPAHAHQWIIRAVGMGHEVLFPGITMTALAALAFVRRRRDDAAASRVFWFYAALGTLAAWASFGPDAGLYAALSEALPFMSFVRAPARFGVLVVFALAVPAGFGLAHAVSGGRRTVAATVLVLIVAVEVSAAPWPLRRVPETPPVYRMLAELPRGPVVEFHFPYRSGDLFQHTRYMFWSTWHWQPLVNGYSDHIPPDFREIVVPINGFPDDASFRILEARGARYVVFHWDTYNADAQATLRARFPPYREHLRPLLQDENAWLFEIVSFPGRGDRQP